MSRKLSLVAFGLVVSMGMAARADTINVVQGSITANLVVDSLGNALALDIRGLAGVTDSSPNFDILTSALAPPAFGNVDLLVVDLPNSADIALAFNPLTLVRTGLDLTVDTTGTLASGTPSTLGQALISKEVFDFVLTGIIPIGGTTDTELTYLLTGATSAAVPEPASAAMFALSLGFVLLTGRKLWVRSSARR